MPVAILMPVFDEASRLARTLERVRERAEAMGGVTVFVVDDGSERAVDGSTLPGPGDAFRVVLARHVVNLGQGAALETARQLALRSAELDVFVTMDSDGQHCADDALSLVQAVRAGADVAFGDRFLGDSEIPPSRRALLHGARVFERVLTGLCLNDAHNGLRAFSRRAIERIPLRQSRMAHATEIKQRIARARASAEGPSLTLVEVPVTVRYSSDTRAKGQRASGAALILRDLLGQYLFGEAE